MFEGHASNSWNRNLVFYVRAHSNLFTWVTNFGGHQISAVAQPTQTVIADHHSFGSMTTAMKLPLPLSLLLPLLDLIASTWQLGEGLQQGVHVKP